MNEFLFYDLREKPALTRSLATQIVQELGRRIIAGEYGPGDLLEDEGTLATRYQVSRSALRDAVKILVGKGILEVRRGIGTRVRPRSTWALLDDDVLAWHQSAPVNRDFLRQLMELRRVIEPMAARWAAERGSGDSHEQIAAAQARMEQERGSIQDFVVADALFHRAILRAAGNEFLLAMEGAVVSALLVSIRQTNRDPRDNETSIPFHRAVTRSILAGDADAAAAGMERLLADAAQRLGSGPEAGESPPRPRFPGIDHPAGDDTPAPGRKPPGADESALPREPAGKRTGPSRTQPEE